MQLFDKQSLLSDIVFSDVSVLHVLNRFGIRLGVGDATVEEICGRRGINAELFLTIVNTHLNDDYFPERELQSFSAGEIADYLRSAYRFCREFLLPNVERHFNSLRRVTAGGNSNIDLLMRFFLEFKQELTDSLAEEEARWSAGSVRHDDGCHCTAATDCCEPDTTVLDKAKDLISFFVIHLRGDCDPNLCTAVVSALFTLEKDLRQNYRIRDRILRPVTSRTGGISAPKPS